MKAARFRSRRLFLLNCRKTNVFPKCLDFDLALDVENLESSQKLEKVVKKFKLKIVSVLISDSQRSLCRIKTSSAMLRRWIDRTLTHEDMVFFDESVQRKEECVYRQCSAKAIAKLENLKTTLIRKLHNHVSSVINHTDTELPDFLLRTLQLGWNFNVPDKKHPPYVRMLAEIESCIQWDSRAETIRNDISNAFINHINYTKQPLHDEHEWIRKDVTKSKRFLKEHADLVVTRADKGKQTVIITREEYDKKMNELVNDESTYERVNKDLTMTTLRKINTMLDLWSREEWIDQSTKHRLKIYHCNPPRIYGLPKTHKENRPLRIICSTIGTVTYKCAKTTEPIVENRLSLNDIGSYAMQCPRSNTLPAPLKPYRAISTEQPKASLTNLTSCRLTEESRHKELTCTDEHAAQNDQLIPLISRSYYRSSSGEFHLTC
ncbi:uncharacterized protein LOC134221951 [Armigeres subalbatus]|uniref:uncharacterized protein LOC134221951 n=1 Tax=Armigeres subalbatus TaxID=124917 RepID=UPI002ED168A6